jgi:hypothetical protein
MPVHVGSDAFDRMAMNSSYCQQVDILTPHDWQTMQDNIVIFTSKLSSDKQKVVIENVKGGIKKSESHYKQRWRP